MYLSDNHTHSSCSPDGNASMTEMVEGAVSAGLRELTITDHCDLLSMEGTITLDFDWQPLREQYAAAEKAVNGRLKLNRGIEIAGMATFQSVADDILQEPLDFVLGSVHNLSVEKGCTDFYDLDYKNNAALCADCLDDYFTSMETMIEWGHFDSLAHLPYLLRYMRDRDGMPVTLDDYEPRIRAILRSIIRKGIALELNTCRGRSVEDYRTLFRWYHEEGGTLITLGSDAHEPENLGKGLKEAQRLLLETGFTQFAVYHNRKPQLIEIIL